MAQRGHVVVDSTDPFERGRQRGVQVADGLSRTWPVYQAIFEAVAVGAGGPPPDVDAIADACLRGTRAWAPDLARELEGVAAGSGQPLAVIAAVNARTEILARVAATTSTECSAVVEIDGPADAPLSAQTWDWHEELSDGWHTQEVRGDRYAFVGLCEFGMLAKIGVNEAGLGVHFNLLRHASEAAPQREAVPVHLMARAVLGRAGTVAEAVDIIRSAPAAASSVITVVTAAGAASVEVSPQGVGVVEPADGWIVHTNHFLDPALARGEAVDTSVSTTFEREDLLRVRAKAVARPVDAAGLADLLRTHDEDGVAVCRHPEPGATLGYRTATLATVILDPARRRALIADGGPCRREPGRSLVAAP